MIAYLFLGLCLLVGFVLLGRWFLQADPGQLSRALKILGVVVGVAVLGLLAATGRLGWALWALPAILPFLMRIAALRRLAQSARGPSPGQRSRVETAWLRMELEHDSGHMDGEVIRGGYSGRRLSSMSLHEVLDLLETVRDEDPQSAALLETWLDRSGHEWQGADAGAGAHAGSGEPPPTGPMDRNEAYRVLGLEPGASPDEIKAAHRKLMRQVHPDHGGSAWLAARINQAKDLLMGK